MACRAPITCTQEAIIGKLTLKPHYFQTCIHALLLADQSGNSKVAHNPDYLHTVEHASRTEYLKGGAAYRQAHAGK